MDPYIITQGIQLLPYLRAMNKKVANPMPPEIMINAISFIISPSRELSLLFSFAT